MPAASGRRWIPRSLEPGLRRAARGFPVVVLTGPRQSGKTSLLRRVFGARAAYASLEPPDVRAAAEGDPRGFLAAHPPPGSSTRSSTPPPSCRTSRSRSTKPGTGPASSCSRGRTTSRCRPPTRESRRPGRDTQIVAVVVEGDCTAVGSVTSLGATPRATVVRVAPPGDLWARFLRGSYPEPVARPRLDAELWHASYVRRTWSATCARCARWVTSSISSASCAPSRHAVRNRSTSPASHGIRCRREHGEGLAVGTGGRGPGVPVAAWTTRTSANAS